MIGRIISTVFQLQFMLLAIDVMDRRGPISEMCRQLQPKKTVLSIYITAKGILPTVHC